MTNKYNKVLYIGFSGNLKERMYQHKTHQLGGWTSKYNAEKLVYYESFKEVTDAIRREKQLKEWNREWKNNLVNKFNPEWKDLWEEVMWWQ
ncbi:MAG: GIY-YIG nuclease family protein [Proteobacteria bacterium]|nr:GIY-YIG nuclease family protein [Pseudomonadota bacterium]